MGWRTSAFQVGAHRSGSRHRGRGSGAPTVHDVHVEVGPVPARSARTWIPYAREVIRHRRAHDPETLPEDVRDGFLFFLDRWEAAAGGEELRWSADVDPGTVEYLVHGFYRVASRLAEEAERPGSIPLPDGGEVFYRSLVNAVLDAMSAEGGPVAEFADQLRPFWPGLVSRRR